MKDLKFALRQFRKRPGITAVARANPGCQGMSFYQWHPEKDWHMIESL